MSQILVFLMLVVASSATSFHNREFVPRLKSAASESQIRFAVENKYDDTGPGSKTAESAYHTYRTLEDALVAYLDDPDTKLPEHEREKAFKKLVQSAPYPEQKLKRYYPKTVEEYTGYKPTTEPIPVLTNLEFSEKRPYKYIERPEGLTLQFNGFSKQSEQEPFRFQKVQPVRGNPLSLAHYSRDPDVDIPQDYFNPHPKYTYSYGVHDRDTGDSKSAQETREGGTVRGYYSFRDADGKQRIVHYTADDHLGFRATVEKE